MSALIWDPRAARGALLAELGVTAGLAALRYRPRCAIDYTLTEFAQRTTRIPSPHKENPMTKSAQDEPEPAPMPEAPLDRQIAYRTNDDELRAFALAAQRSGLKVQTWMRRVLRRASGLSKPKRI